MITYNELYELLRKERYSEQLQVLPKSFLKEVFDYFDEKKKVSDKEEGLFSDISLKNKKQYENAISIFKEILSRRKKKILNLGFVASETGISKKDFENLLEFEKELFEEILKSLEKADKNLNESMSGSKEESKYKLVTFLEPVSGLVNFSGDEIGPFEKGEVANIDKEIADILVKDKKVEVIED